MPRALRILFLILTGIFGVARPATADSHLPRLVVRCGGTFDLCGFVDRYTEAQVIPRRYEQALMFSEGLAGVRIDGLWGFIDESGATVIAPRFDLVGTFHRGRAEVLVGRETGVIDRQGNIVLEPKFARSIPLTEDLVLVREGRYDGYGQLRNGSESTSLVLNSDFGLLSIRSGWLVRPPLAVRLFDADLGLIWASREGVTFGLLRTDGTWKVEPQFSDVQPLLDERAAVCGYTATDHLCGAVDKTGTLVVPLQFSQVGSWVNGFAIVRLDGKAGFVDKNGNLIGGKLFDRVERDERLDVGKVLVKGILFDEWFGLDRQGRLTALPDAPTVTAVCPSGVKMIRTGDQVQVVGADGQPTVPYPLDNYVRLSCDKPSSVRLGSKWGFVGTNGRLLFDPPQFDNQIDFVDGYAAVQKDGKWGFIDVSGRYAVAPRYDALRHGSAGLCPFRSHECKAGRGLYHVTEDGRQFWVDANGHEQPEPPPDRTAYLACGDEGARIKFVESAEGRSWGIVDAAGRDIIKPQYRGILCFSGGVAWVPDDSKQQWCPVDPNGSRREHPDCIRAAYPDARTDSHPQPFSADPYENSVLYTQAFLEFGAGLRDEAPIWCSDFGSSRPQCKRPQRNPIALPTKRPARN